MTLGQSLKFLSYSFFISSTEMIIRTSVMELLGEFIEIKYRKVHMAWNTVNAQCKRELFLLSSNESLTHVILSKASQLVPRRGRLLLRVK